MIVGSLLLLVAGAGLLIAGLVSGNDSLLIGTIVASLVAAACLYAVNRGSGPSDQRASSARRDDSEAPYESDERLSSRRGYTDDDYGRGAEAEVPRSRRASRSERVDIEVDTDGVPADEPSESPMSSVEAAALMRMDTEVMVVDGRPRFHLGGCVHLMGRDVEPLPAYEAVELGFTACSLCRPAQSLLRQPTRH
ncbi:hypothetical protein [Stackebrandtia soli]|uniref:hypothetical protein n=1 Tax=Stackebrandtia soli TaxID=1892856 RepID=UPI0039E7A315